MIQVGSRVQCTRYGEGIVAMQNEDATWNVDFDDGTEADLPGTELRVCDNQVLDDRVWNPPAKEQVEHFANGARVVRNPDAEPKPDGWTRFVCFSDTHGLHNEIPAKHYPVADVLLHAGDFSNTGEAEQVESLNEWFKKYPANHKVVIAGNHDVTFHEEYYFERGANRFHRGRRAPYDCRKTRELLRDCIYLEDSCAEVCGYLIYGSPWQPEFCDWAFNLPRGGELLRQKWGQIPDSVDILMTHSPPKGYGDRCTSGFSAGCEDLRAAIGQRAVSVNLFGHIHEGYGCWSDKVTLFVNASTCNHSYRPINAPIVFDLPPVSELRAATQQAALARDT
jgi:predicted phosphodiesterase